MTGTTKLGMWSEIWNYVKRGKRTNDVVDENSASTNEIVSESTYPVIGMNYRESVKQYNWFHCVFKYKFLLPLIVIVEKVVWKRLTKKVPKCWYNREMEQFDLAWSDAMTVMDNNYNKGFSTHGRYEALRRIFITLVLNDTATHEFIKVLLHCIAVRMQKRFRGGKVHHILYTSKNSYCPIYFNLGQIIQKYNMIPYKDDGSFDVNLQYHFPMAPRSQYVFKPGLRARLKLCWAMLRLHKQTTVLTIEQDKLEIGVMNDGRANQADKGLGVPGPGK